MEWYKKYRPKTLKEVMGQPQTVAALEKFVERKNLPHAILLVGPSGTGKTTLARLIGDFVGAQGTDFQEFNTADFRGIETIRALRQSTNFKGMFGEARVFLIDECHQLTGDAQEAMLKMLEDCSKHIYFILGTTEGQKLKKTLVSRCQKFELKALDDGALIKILKRVCKGEKCTVPDDLLAEIVNASGGSARLAISTLEKVTCADGPEEARAYINEQLTEVDSITLCRALCKPGAAWDEVSVILKALKEKKVDAESLRIGVLGYAAACLLGAKGTNAFAKRARFIMMPFSYNFYDTKFSGLVAACWDVINAR